MTIETNKNDISQSSKIKHHKTTKPKLPTSLKIAIGILIFYFFFILISEAVLLGSMYSFSRNIWILVIIGALLHVKKYGWGASIFIICGYIWNHISDIWSAAATINDLEILGVIFTGGFFGILLLFGAIIALIMPQSRKPFKELHQASKKDKKLTKTAHIESIAPENKPQLPTSLKVAIGFIATYGIGAFFPPLFLGAPAYVIGQGFGTITLCAIFTWALFSVKKYGWGISVLWICVSISRNTLEFLKVVQPITDSFELGGVLIEYVFIDLLLLGALISLIMPKSRELFKELRQASKRNKILKQNTHANIDSAALEYEGNINKKEIILGSVFFVSAAVMLTLLPIFTERVPNGQDNKILIDDKKHEREPKNRKPLVQETKKFPDGSKYVGEFIRGEPHGQGTYTYADGSKYVGEFIIGEPHGQGTYTYADGSKYVGEFIVGDQHGNGTYTYADGSKYVGEFEEGKRHGQGTYTYSDGRKYVGEWKNDIFVEKKEPNSLKSCKTECAEMFKKGELQKGMNIEGCIKALCEN